MKVKRLLAGLLAVMMCFALVACGEESSPKKDKQPKPIVTGPDQSAPTQGAPAPTQPSVPVDPPAPEPAVNAPLLYRVSDANGNVAWLFGSIHVGREDYYPLPAHVLAAFEGADSLAVELDIQVFEQDMAMQMEALGKLVYTDGTTIKNHISAELYEKAVAALTAENTYMPALDMYCAAFWSSLLDSLLIEKLGVQLDLGIDRHFLTRAKELGKEIVDIESGVFQYAMMANYSDALQELLLEESLESMADPDTYKADLDDMMDLWASGDEAAFAAYLAEEPEDMTAEETVLYDEYQKAMLTDRNLNMADFAEQAIASGKEVFIVVGAAHVVGDGALAQLMAQRGYTVELVTQ